MSKSIIQQRGLDIEVIKMYSESGEFKKVVEELRKIGHDDITVLQVESFIHSVQRKSESPALIISEHDAELVETNMRYRINLQQKTVHSLNQAEEHISEIEDHYNNTPKLIKLKCSKCQADLTVNVKGFNEKSYHTAKDSAIRTKNDLIKHLRSTQIKFMELAKNQVLRESIMEAIREVDADVADKIFQKIEQKQRELGMI